MGRRLPIPVEPLPDELLSSWLGCDPLALGGAIWPKWRPWTIDIDRGLPENRTEVLSRFAGIPIDKIHELTLRPLAATMQGRDLSSNGTWTWILTVGSRNRTRAHGPMFCGECLRIDAVPYFRRSWRLGWHVACPEHGVWLQDACPKCGTPVQYHRLDAEHQVITRCFGCGESLVSEKLEAASPSMLAFQAQIDGLLNGRALTINGVPQLGSSDFEVLWHFEALIHTGLIKPRSSLHDFVQGMGLKMPQEVIDSIKRVSFERMALHERREELQGIAKLCEVSSCELGKQLVRAGVPQRTFAALRPSVPEGLKSVVAKLRLNPPKVTKNPPRKKRATTPKFPTVQEFAFLLRYLRWKYGVSK